MKFRHAVVVLLGAFVFTASPVLGAVCEVSGGHAGLQCTSCHLTPPDEAVDTAATVTFVNPDPVELCLGCHEKKRHLVLANSPINYNHSSFLTLPPTMVSHYQQWLAAHPQYQDNPIELYNGNSVGCTGCHPMTKGLYTDIPMTKGLYTDIPMTNGEFCIACHGGAMNPDPGAVGQRSSKPRILYNPSHLGVKDASGDEIPPPAGAPNSGDSISEIVPLPVGVISGFHTNVRGTLTYRIEVDWLSDGGTPDENEDFSQIDPAFTPMRWYTGDTSAPRWPNEHPVHKIGTLIWPAGQHKVNFIPYNPAGPIEGAPYSLIVNKPLLNPLRQLIPPGQTCGPDSGERTIETYLDIAGNSLELHCENRGAVGFEFILWHSTASGVDTRIGRCPWRKGQNSTYFTHTGYNDVTRKLNSFVGTFWRSVEPNAYMFPWITGYGVYGNQSTANSIDWKTYEFEVAGRRRLARHFTSKDGPGNAEPDYLVKEALDTDPIFFNPDPVANPDEMAILTYEPSDNDGSGTVDGNDYLLATLAVGSCIGGNYNELADADHDGCVTADDLAELYPFVPVTIDIKPGSDPNSINRGSAGVIPVAIMSTAVFDATQIDPATVALAGSAIKLVGKTGRYLSHVEDVNGDGLLDFVCQVSTNQAVLEMGQTSAELLATTYAGVQVRGLDSVNIVQ